MPDLLAIIPFYKRQDQLDKCLAALSASTYPGGVEPYIHDNNTNNLGYTKACNLGLREALRRGHQYAILLNQDCYVQPDAIEKAITFMDAHPRCAICGPKQLVAEDPDRIIHGGCTDAYPLGRHFVGHVSKGECAVSLPMPWVNGACMVVRVEAIYDFGLMDEGFYIIASDSDYCFSARQRGWEVWYCAESVVLHESGGVSSTGEKSLDMLAHFNADQIRFRDKWIGTHGWELLKQVPPHRALSPQEFQTALQQATQHYNKNELTQAELLCRHLLSYLPENPDLLLILGRVYTRLNMPALGARDLRKVVAASPDSAQAHLALADALNLCGLAQDSVNHYHRARELGIHTTDLQNNLGVALNRLGQPQEAIAAWREALTLDPANPTARKNLQDAGVRDLPPPPQLTPPSSFGGAVAPGTFRLG